MLRWKEVERHTGLDQPRFEAPECDGESAEGEEMEGLREEKARFWEAAAED